MEFDLILKKKSPRLFLALPDELAQPLNGTHLVWPDRSITNILDMSYAGIVISSSGVLTKIKKGQTYDAKIYLESSNEAMALKLKATQIQAKSVGFLINTMNVNGRLMIDQVAKDDLVLKNFRSFSTNHFREILRSDIWFHAPFDTNVFIWEKDTKQGSAGLSKAFVEYDNLLLHYDMGKIKLQKSTSASEEIRGYEAPLTQFSGNVSMGVSWLDRLIKILTQLDEKTGKLTSLIQILRTQKDN